MPSKLEAKIQELSAQYGFDADVLREFAVYVQSLPKPRKSSKPKSPTVKELQVAVSAAFGCEDVKELKRNGDFNLACAGRSLNLARKEAWLILYREWVGVPQNEQSQTGETCINGIDVLKNFRPWQVFGLNSQSATVEDINAAYRSLVKTHHPDRGGRADVFERLTKMRDSLLAFKK